MTTERRLPSDSKPQRSLPHDYDREGGQPYAKEVEDYDRGVASPPEGQVGCEPNSRTKKTAPSQA
jgi:hypothetical protein